MNQTTSVAGAARRAAEKTRERPRVLLVAGGAIAFLGWLALLWAGYSYFIAESFSALEALLVGLLGATLYAAGMLAFAYGWERGDADKAVKTAVLFGIVGLAMLVLAALGVVVVAALAGALTGSRGGSRSGSSSRSGGGRFDSRGGSLIPGAGRSSAFGGRSSGGSSFGSASRSAGGSGGGGDALGSIGRGVGEIAGGFARGATESEGSRRLRRPRRVIPPAEPADVQLVSCANCGRLKPADALTCPFCGGGDRS